RCGGWRRGTTYGEQNFVSWLSGTTRAKLHDDRIVTRSSGVGWRRVATLGFPAPADGSRLAPVVDLRISSSRDLVYWTRELLPRSKHVPKPSDIWRGVCVGLALK
ncbi:unnamed protein product, partial [Brassica oleracea]